jgi:hypothetical protein
MKVVEFFKLYNIDLGLKFRSDLVGYGMIDSDDEDYVSHPIYKNINRAIIYAPGSSHAYIQQITKISQHMS